MGTGTTWLAVAVGGAVGSLARFWLAAAMTTLTGPRFPWGTLLINVVGSFVIGLVAAVTLTPARVADASRPADLPHGRRLWRLHHLLGLQPADVGTAAVRRYLAGAGYVAGSVVLCLAAVWAGLASVERNFASHSPREYGISQGSATDHGAWAIVTMEVRTREGMKLLLTGGCGFIGSAVVRHLMRDTDHVVINVDKLTYAASEDALEEARGHNRHVLIRADITDAAAMRQIFATHQPDAVMHLAAESHVDRSIDGPADVHRDQRRRHVHAAGACAAVLRQAQPPTRRATFRFHHISTDEVFGALGAGDPPFDETTRYDPRSPYSASKAASDHLVRAWFHTYGLPTLVSNTANNYGPWQFPEKLIPLVTLNALEGKPLPVYGDGSNRRDWIFVEDHAVALVRVLEHGEPGATYAIGARQPRSNLDVVRAICAELDRRLPDPAGARERLIHFVTDRPGHDFRYEIDPTRAEAALGWTAPHDFEAGLARTIEWYLANRDWWQAVRAGRYAGQRLGTAA